MRSYMVSIKPYYENVSEKYINIITLDRIPKESEALLKIVRVLNVSRLSTFNRENSCVYAVYDPENTNKLISIKEISKFFDYIIMNGYNINEELTRIMKNSKENILCFIEKK